MREVPDPPDGLRPVDPREWMRVWARVTAEPSIKNTGAWLAHFADYQTGAEIRPGNALLMKVTGIKGNKTVISALAQIRDWGLIWRYAEGSKNGRQGKSDVYRLTFPDDVTGIPLLSPDWEEPCG